MNEKPESVDAYIAGFPAEIQSLLTQVRTTIQQAAPEAQETIKYSMPAYVLNGNLVYFAAFKRHIGFFPTPSAIEAFKDRLAGYQLSKGTVQLPLDRPLPLDLIAEMVRFRVAENKVKRSRKK